MPVFIPAQSVYGQLTPVYLPQTLVHEMLRSEVTRWTETLVTRGANIWSARVTLPAHVVRTIAWGEMRQKQGEDILGLQFSHSYSKYPPGQSKPTVHVMNMPKPESDGGYLSSYLMRYLDAVYMGALANALGYWVTDQGEITEWS